MRTIIFSIISISFYLSNIYISFVSNKPGFAFLFFLLASFGMAALACDYQESMEEERAIEEENKK